MLQHTRKLNIFTYEWLPLSLQALQSQTGFNKNIRVLTIVLSISSSCLVLLDLSAVVFACSKKKKMSRVRGQGSRVHALAKHYTDVQKEDLDLPFFGFSDMAKATNNFLIDNKLGEGGFGPVYKGVLEDGQEIAVNRLSQTSAQGHDEFQNELFALRNFSMEPCEASWILHS